VGETSVYTWGWGNDGRLGHGAESYLLTPKAVAALHNKGIAEISCGYYHSAARSENAVYTWGAGAHGRLGHGSVEDVSVPRVVRGELTGNKVTQISCGGYHTVVLSREGGLFTWGHGANGRLGHGKGCEDQTTPGRVLCPRVEFGVVEIACGEHHTGVRTADGRVLTWGRGAFGRLGHGDEADASSPREVEALRGLGVSQIACGVYHTLVVTECGVYIWGTESAGHAPAKADLLPALVPNSEAWIVQHTLLLPYMDV